MADHDEHRAEPLGSEADSAGDVLGRESASLAGGERQGRRLRTDAGRLHATRHAVLSRYPLQALRHLGEDPKSLRRLERRFRAELKPQGVIAEVLFDRFWSSYLRCLLAARTECSTFLRQHHEDSKGNRTCRLLEGPLPTFVVDDSVHPEVPASLDEDVLRELALVTRYDAHFGKEMYKAMGLLLVSRRHGHAGLEAAFCNLLGVEG